MTKDPFKKDYDGLKLNVYTIIGLIASIALAVGLAVYVGDGSGRLSRNWFWVFSGVSCLGIGVTCYAHGLTQRSGILCVVAGIILVFLGALWFTADIVCNGMGGTVGGGWWIGLISATVVALLMYFVPLIVKFIIKKRK